MTVGVVAELQGELALQRLPIADPRLGFDARAPRLGEPAANLRVPRSEVVLDRERHLGAPTEGRVKARPEPLEQRQLGAIPDRVAGWVDLDREVQAQDGKPSAQVGERDTIDLTALEPPQLTSGAAGRRSRDAEAQARGNTGITVLRAEPMHACPKPAPTPIVTSFASCHGYEASDSPLIRRFTGVLSRHAGQGTNGSALGPPRLAPPTLGVTPRGTLGEGET